MMQDSKDRSDETGLDTVATQCAKFAQLLGLDVPVSEEVLYAATSDEVYANRLLGARRNAAALEFLLTRPPQGPSAKRQPFSNGELVRKATIAFMRWGKTGFSVARREQLESRRSACLACPELSDPPDSAAYKLVAGAEKQKICSACGCNVWAKTRMLSEACPLEHLEREGVNRWGEPLTSSALEDA